MPPACAPLPLTVLERIKEFVEQRRTGQVALNFRDGAFMGFDLKEHYAVQGDGRAAGAAVESRA